MPHILAGSYTVWYLISGKKWDGRVEIHRLISGFSLSLSLAISFSSFVKISYSRELTSVLLLRGAGFISLENLLFFSKTFSVSYYYFRWYGKENTAFGTA